MQVVGNTADQAAAEQAILSADRKFRIEILVDWNRDGGFTHKLSNLSGFADNIVVNRSLSGSAPSEIMLIEGNAAAELTFDIGGELSPDVYGAGITSPMSFVSVFSPYNGFSPFYNMDTIGAEVRYRVGIDTPIGTMWYQQFIGNIRTISPNRGSDSVTFSALDRVEKLRRPITHTDWGMLDLQANQGFISGQLMSSHWVIDHCLRFGECSPSPYRWSFPEAYSLATQQIFISGNGSHAPNVGWVDGSYQNQFPDTDRTPALTMLQDYGQSHPNLLSPDTNQKPQMLRAQRDWGNDLDIYWANNRRKADTDQTFTCAFTLHTQDLAGSQWYTTMPDSAIMEYSPKSTRTVTLMMGAGKVWIRFVDSGGVPLTYNGVKMDLPTTGTHVRITWEYAWSTGERIKLQVGSTVGATETMRGAVSSSMTSQIGRFRVWRKIAMQDISAITHGYTIGTAGDVVSPTAKYSAVLDRGLNRFSFLPKRWGSLAWDVIAEVAAAEFGAVHWDEYGVFRFWNQDTIRSKKDTVVRTLTLDDIGSLDITSSADSVRNVYAITAKKARVQNVKVYETSGPDEIVLPPGGTFFQRVWIDDIVTPNSAQLPVYGRPGNPGSLPEWNDEVVFGGVTSWLLENGTWQQFNNSAGEWSARMYRMDDGSTMLDIYNGFTRYVKFAYDSTAAFRWNGSKMTKFDDQVFIHNDLLSIDKYAAQGLELAGDWYQEFYNKVGFIDKIVARTAKPIPTTDNVSIAGDPRLQLGDAIRVVDPEGLGEELRLQILGINRTFTRDGGLVDDLTVEMVEPPRVGIWDSAQYGRWNQTFVWSD